MECAINNENKWIERKLYKKRFHAKYSMRILINIDNKKNVLQNCIDI